MALTTLAGLQAGLLPKRLVVKQAIATPVAGRAHTYWYQAGQPAAGAAPSPGLAGQALTAPVAGAIPLDYPGGRETVVARASCTGIDRSGQWWLVDRLWHNSGLVVTSTAAQTINSVPWPARDINQSSDGEGVFIAAELSVASGNGGPTLGMTYTNSQGVGGRTSANIFTFSTNPAVGSWFIMGLQAGDTGVRSIQTFTLTASITSGAVHLVAFRPIVLVTTTSLNSGGQSLTRNTKTIEDAIGMCAPRVFPGSVLQACGVSSGTTMSAMVALDFAQG